MLSMLRPPLSTAVCGDRWLRNHEIDGKLAIFP
jgi:hypothetical protein